MFLLFTFTISSRHLEGIRITVETQVCIIDCVFLALSPRGLCDLRAKSLYVVWSATCMASEGMALSIFFFLHIIIGVGDTTLALDSQLLGLNET